MKIKYDFIEVGTSDFHTLIQDCGDEVVGLSIEPITEYINNLPDKPNVTKIKAALSDEDGEIQIYRIPSEEITKNYLPFWVRGCNSVNRPHEYTKRRIGSELYDKLVKIDTVSKISWEKLIKDYNIGSIDYLKIDTEGHEHVILKKYFEICKTNPQLYAKKIKFEFNETSNKKILEEIISNLENYKVTYLEEDILLELETGLFYKGKKVADRGFLLNLPHRTDRLESSKKLLDELGFTGYEIFEGTTLENPEFKKLGCTSSYLKMFEEILNSENNDVVVFEDDIKLMRGTTTDDLDRIFRDWDEIKLKYDSVALGTKLLPRSKINIQGSTYGSFQEMLCTQSFYYKKEIIKHVYDELKDYLNPNHVFHKCTIDMFLNDCSCEKYRFIHSDRHKKFNFGITLPMIFTQSSDFSDNENKIQNYEQEMEVNYHNALKTEKAYVLYSTENYIGIVTESVKSIREFSNLPIIVYLINSDKQIDVDNTTTVRWNYNIGEISDDLYIKNDENFYIKRENPTIYKILSQRPLIIKDALGKHAKTVCYVDSDSIATPLVDTIFSYYDEDSFHPYFVEGIYEFLTYNGKGGGGPAYGGGWESTLEHPTCELFNVDQSVRKYYRQTGYFVAGQNTYDFLDEWYWMCNHPKILNNVPHYVPYNEETISNVLLWKYKIEKGLPYIYVNGSLETIKKMYNEVEYKGPGIFNFLGSWLRAPEEKNHLLFFHGEKNPEKMKKMVQEIKKYNENKLRVLFLAPHLSTGGMPSYLLKRIESLISLFPDVEIYVAEFCQYSTLYTVQRDRIRQLIPEERFWTINALDNHNVENSMKVMDIIKNNMIDIVHIDEMAEGFDSFNKMPSELKNALYDDNRTWRVVETCHNVWFDPNTSKSFHPDAYAFCTPYHKEVTFKQMPSHKEVFEFPIENKFRSRENQVRCLEILGLDTSKVHVLNVGLWTSGKNQKEGLEIARHFQDSNIEFHFVGNQASNFENYWGPLMNDLPSNVRIWGERSDVETFMVASDILMFNSTWECNPLVIREAASFGLKIMARDLPQYVGMFNGLICPLVDDITSNVSSLKKLISSSRNYRVLDGMTNEFAEKHYQLYKFLLTQKPTKKIVKKSNVTIKRFFINQPFLEILGDSESEFEVKFFDEVGMCHYNDKIKSNHWIKLNRKYFTKWNTKIYENGVVIYDETLNYSGKRVFINFDSKSLGDTVSWIPYVLEFKKAHNCDVVVSTYWNHLFKEVYPELEFTQPGTVVHNIFGQYNLGWFWDISKEPELPNTIPLQKAATNILGLPYSEIKPKIHYKIGERPYSEKYITIATNSTAGCKFWTKEGWQELINYLNSLGYKVVNVSKENNPFNNCERLDDTSIENTMNVIHHSEFFIGLSSGLSWLSWAIGKHVVMISNFTEANHEFTTNCTRITNPNVCNSCWNNPNFKFDKGDWYWCPVHKGTSRQFECHTSITSEMVINKIQHLLK
jgi:autotransporter strand-loop-strand O-heptosyltransferase